MTEEHTCIICGDAADEDRQTCKKCHLESIRSARMASHRDIYVRTVAALTRIEKLEARTQDLEKDVEELLDFVHAR